MSHAPRLFQIVANKDGSNAHAFGADEKPSRSSRLCYGDNVTAGKTFVATVECYDGVANYDGDLCGECRRTGSSIAATERGFAFRTVLEQALRNGASVTLDTDAIKVVLSSLAPWEAEGIDVRPDGEPLVGSDED